MPLPVIALTIGAVLLASSSLANAQDIEIKGLSIGLSKDRLIEMHGPLPIRNFTIAGVPGTSKELLVFFRDDRLDSLYFFFKSSEFDEVLNAVKEKYPALRCVDSTVATAVGGRLTQTDCKLTSKAGILRLSRFGSDILSSSLTLISHENERDARESARKRKRDI